MPEVAAGVAGCAPIIVDDGFRRGTDISFTRGDPRFRGPDRMWDFRTRGQAKSRYVLPEAPRDLAPAAAGSGQDAPGSGADEEPDRT